MFNFFSEYWYVVSSAFSSEPWYALFMSLPFLFFSILFLFAFIFSGFIIYEDIYPPENPEIYRGNNGFGGAIIILFTIFLIFPILIAVPNMESIKLQPHFLPRIIDKLLKDNLNDIKDNNYSAYFALEGFHLYRDNNDFINFKNELLNNVPQNTIVTQGQVSAALQKNYISCLEFQKLDIYLKATAIKDIYKDIAITNKLCVRKASEQLIADVKHHPNILLKKILL